MVDQMLYTMLVYSIALLDFEHKSKLSTRMFHHMDLNRLLAGEGLLILKSNADDQRIHVA